MICKILPLVLISQYTQASITSDQIDHALNSLSLEQKVSQMLVMGFAGKSYNKSMGPRLRKFQPGAMIIFKRNIDTPFKLFQMIRQAQEEAIRTTGLPLLLMIDQEGGQVTRFKTTPPAPSALALAQSGDDSLIEGIGYVTGRILELVGINMNLAPVLDLSDPNKRSFIGNRSFGKSASSVSRTALAFSNGLIRSGVIPAAKHFPGHGGISQDSHKGSTVKRASAESLFSNDLIPFKNFADFSKISSIMVAHVNYPSLDSSRLPATYSKKIISGLLRRKMKYNGLVITDDLEMFGAAQVGNIEKRIVKAVEAGSDLLMVAWSRKKQSRARKALIRAVQSGRIPISRINESVRRIITAKLWTQKHMDLDSLTAKQRQTRIQFYFNELKGLTEKTLFSNFKNSLLSTENGHLKFPHEENAIIFSADSDFFMYFKKSFSGKSFFVPILRRKRENVASYLRKYRNRFAVYYTTGTLSARRTQLIPSDVRKRVIIINSTYPGLIKNSKSFARVININSRSAQSGKWIARVLNSAQNIMRAPSSRHNPRTWPARRDKNLRSASE